MKRFLTYSSIILLSACSGSSEENSNENSEPEYIPLPHYGLHDVDPGSTDTIYYEVPPYFLLAHDSSDFTNEVVSGKIHVVNFFFTHCPTICPAMIEQMKVLQENTEDIEEITFLSHTIDPVRDTVPRLRQYIQDRNIDTRNWYFLYGSQEYIHQLGNEGYLINAMEDEKADGGFLHSEHFVLVDREGHIRGYYVGTDPAEVKKLETDIRELIKNEYGD